MNDELTKDVSVRLDRVLRELVEFEERRSNRQEFQEWSEGVYKSVEALQKDVTVLRKDFKEHGVEFKELTGRFAELDKALELLRKDHEHDIERGDARWETLQALLAEIKEGGCALAPLHAEDLPETVGHTGWDLVHKLTPLNVGLTGVIALLIMLVLYHDKILAFFGIG